MNKLHLPRVESFLQHLLPDLFRPAPAAHHPGIGELLLQDPAQAFHVMDVFPSHNYVCCQRIVSDPVQCFAERPAKHVMRAGGPGFFSVFLPVLDYRNLIAQRHGDPDHTQRHMPGAADYQLLAV